MMRPAAGGPQSAAAIGEPVQMPPGRPSQPPVISSAVCSRDFRAVPPAPEVRDAWAASSVIGSNCYGEAIAVRQSGIS